jgi:hypothetical protein
MGRKSKGKLVTQKQQKKKVLNLLLPQKTIHLSTGAVQLPFTLPA